MREIKDISNSFIRGGAVTVMDVNPCSDWTTCDEPSLKHVHGVGTIAGPNVPQFQVSTIAHSNDEAIVALALKLAVVAFVV